VKNKVKVKTDMSEVSVDEGLGVRFLSSAEEKVGYGWKDL